MRAEVNKTIMVTVLSVSTILFLTFVSHFFAWISFAKAQLELNIELFPDIFTGNSEEAYEFTFKCGANYRTNITLRVQYLTGLMILGIRG